MRRTFRILFLFLALCQIPVRAESGPAAIRISKTLEFSSSNLPILIIDAGGQNIADNTRITAHLGVIHNASGVRNNLTDPFTDYDGLIAVELRGSATSGYPKKQYRFETRDAAGENKNVSLLGLPEENDWILYGPYTDDQSMVRNPLAYELSNDMGRYASRTAYCEVVLDGDYRGLYILMEKIKRDKNRVAISELDPNDLAGDSLTGGYIIKIDKTEGENLGGWKSSNNVRYQYHYPKADEIQEAQKFYIQAFMNRFETILSGSNISDPQTGYPSVLDVDAAVDHFLLCEVSKNVDAYRISSFMYKDRDSKDGRLAFGPIWDYNLSFGNSWFSQDYFVTDMWAVDYNDTHPYDGLQVPFFWIRLSRDPYFVRKAVVRYTNLRRTLLDEDNLYLRIDLLAAGIEEARIRNSERWPVTQRRSYAEEILQMKGWIHERLAWMDVHLCKLSPDSLGGADSFVLSQNYPNPFNSMTTIPYTLLDDSPVTIQVFSTNGRRIRTLVDGTEQAGIHSAEWDGRDDSEIEAASGVYLIHCRLDAVRETRKAILVR